MRRQQRYQLSLLLGVAEGEGHFGPDVDRPPLLRNHVVQEVEQHVVVLQQRDATVLVAERHVGLVGPDVGEDLTREAPQGGLERGAELIRLSWAPDPGLVQILVFFRRAEER